jgi:hypothetical protein
MFKPDKHVTDEHMIASVRASAIAEDRERCAKIAEGYDYPLAGASTGQVIARLIRGNSRT